MEKKRLDKNKILDYNSNMPRKTAIRHAKTPERRAMIIRAALQCFVELGFTDTTMEDIRRRSNASNGSIYYHFSNKEKLATAVYLEGLSDYQEGFLEEIERNPEARDGVYAAVNYHLRWVDEHPDWARYLAQMRHAEFMETTEVSVAELNRPFMKRLFGWLKWHIETGAVRRLPPDLFVPLIIGPCQEYVRLWLGGQTQTGPSDVCDELAHAAWLAVRGQE